MSAAQPTAEPNVQPIEARRAAIRGSVIAGAELTGSYLAMNVAAALIAGFGLMENSPAVIIGAMLIAMLFGPIIGIAMALAEADLRLLGRALKAELVGAICVLAIGCLIGLSMRHLTIGSEILNRTAPNLLDLLIALVGGLAGGFTFLFNELEQCHCRRRHRNCIGAAVDDLRHPFGSRTAGVGDRRVLAVLGQLLGDRFWSNGRLSTNRISPCCNRESPKGARAAIDIRRPVARSCTPSIWHPSAYQRTGNTPKQHSTSPGPSDCESSRRATGRSQAGRQAR